jgi:hypothetical protein
VAGGPSARSFDLNLLSGKTVVAVNDAVFRLEAHAFAVAPILSICSLDNTWIRRHRDYLSSFAGEKFFALPLETWPDCARIPGATYLQWSHQSGLSEDPGFLETGGHSGYGAVNLAYLKRARSIHLVGYDLDPSEKSHFEEWAKAYGSMIPQLQKRGVAAHNHNPKSFITAFPKVPA